MRTYLVKTYSARGALTNHHEIRVASAKELLGLRKFMKASHAKVRISPVKKRK